MEGRSLHNLGHTRSSHQRNHLLLAPDTFVRTTMPGMKKASAIVHISPAIGARFTQYTVEFESGGELTEAAAQRFVYVLEGALSTHQGTFGPGSFVWFPEGGIMEHGATTDGDCTFLFITNKRFDIHYPGKE